MFGKEIVWALYSDLAQEVLSIITGTTVAAASKASGEKTKQGRIVWSGKDFNVPLGQRFRAHGWQKRKIHYPGQDRYFIDVDYCKGAWSG
jgi:hypothetical protein